MIGVNRGRIVVIASPPLHGKTRLAREIQSLVPTSKIIDVDEIRREMFPNSIGIVLPEQEEKTVMVRCYHEMCTRAVSCFREGALVLLPATFSRKEFKDELQAIAILPDVFLKIFYLQVSSFETIKTRIEQRVREGSASNIKTEEQYKWALTLPAPWWNGTEITMLDGTLMPEFLARTVLSKIS
jgi:predicted kinase